MPDSKNRRKTVDFCRFFNDLEGLRDQFSLILRLCWLIFVLSWSMLRHLGPILIQLGDKMGTQMASWSQDGAQERQDEVMRAMRAMQAMRATPDLGCSSPIKSFAEAQQQDSWSVSCKLPDFLTCSMVADDCPEGSHEIDRGRAHHKGLPRVL